MRYDAEWGVGTLVVLVVGIAFVSLFESEESIEKRLLNQKKEEAIDLERATRMKPKLHNMAQELVDEEEEKARAEERGQ